MKRTTMPREAKEHYPRPKLARMAGSCLDPGRLNTLQLHRTSALSRPGAQAEYYNPVPEAARGGPRSQGFVPHRDPITLRPPLFRCGGEPRRAGFGRPGLRQVADKLLAGGVHYAPASRTSPPPPG